MFWLERYSTIAALANLLLPKRKPTPPELGSYIVHRTGLWIRTIRLFSGRFLQFTPGSFQRDQIGGARGAFARHADECTVAVKA